MSIGIAAHDTSAAVEKFGMRHTEEQIAFALKQAETGTSMAEVIRRMGSRSRTFTGMKCSTGSV